MPELVLYGIRLLAKQFLGAIRDIEVDHSAASLSLISEGKLSFSLPSQIINYQENKKEL